MKYIRTKNGVYEYLGEDNLGWRKLRLEGRFIVTQDPRVEIIREADTIEELCDEFIRVVHYTKATPFSIRPFPINWEERGKGAYEEEMRRCLEEQKEMKLRGDDFDLYGAIWIDQEGLIYVAKLNEKGEMELL